MDAVDNAPGAASPAGDTGTLLTTPPADGTSAAGAPPAPPATGEPPKTTPGQEPAKADAPTADQAAKADPAKEIPATPGDYALTFAEGTQVHEGLLGSFRETAHALGLDKAQAQAIAALYEKHVATAQQEYTAGMSKMVEGWEEQIKASPTYEKDLLLARNAIAQYGSDDLTKVLNESRMGSHPALWGFVVAVGKALGEPGFKGKSAAADGNRTAAEILYPRHG